MTPPVRPQLPDFSHLNVEEQKEEPQGVPDFSHLNVPMPTVAADVTETRGALYAEPGGTQQLVPMSGVMPSFGSVTELLDQPKRELTRQTEITPTKLGVGPVAEGLRIVGQAASHPIQTVFGLLSLPAVVGWEAGKDLAQNSALFSEEYNNKAKEVLGEMTPDEARAARRGLLAFTMALLVPNAVGNFLGAALGGEAALAAGTRIVMPGSVRSILRGRFNTATPPAWEAMPRFSADVARGISARAGAFAGIGSFGYIHANTEEEKQAAVLGYSMLMAPFVIGLAPLFLLRGRTAETIRANDIADFRRIRGFEEIGLDHRLPPGRGKGVVGEVVSTAEPTLAGRPVGEAPVDVMNRPTYLRRAEVARQEREATAGTMMETVGTPISDIAAGRINRAMEIVGVDRYNERIEVALSKRGRMSVRAAIDAENVRIIEEEARITALEVARLERQSARDMEMPASDIPISRNYAEAQKVVDQIEDQLVARYGEDALLAHAIPSSGRGKPPFTLEELARYEDALAARDAIGRSDDLAELNSTFNNLTAEARTGLISEAKILDILQKFQERRNLKQATQGKAPTPDPMELVADIYNTGAWDAINKGDVPSGFPVIMEEGIDLVVRKEQVTFNMHRDISDLVRQSIAITRDVLGVEPNVRGVNVLLAHRAVVEGPTPEALTTAEVGDLPKQQEIESNQVVTNNFIQSGLDVVSTILRSHTELHSDGISIITGVTSIGDIVRQVKTILPPGTLIAKHLRPDGTYDVAVGGVNSKLKGAVAQFETTGHYEGETVAVDGKHYEFVRSGVLRDADGNNVDVAWVRHPEEGVDALVPWEMNRVRRAGWANEKPVERITQELLQEISEALTPVEFKAFKRIIDELNPTDGTIAPSGTLESSAASNNFMVRKSAPGRWDVLDQETGVVIKHGLKSKKEAETFINETTQAAGPTFVGSGNVPPDIPVDPIMSAASPPPPGNSMGLMEPMVIPKVGRISSIIDWFQQAMGNHMRYLVDAKTRIEALDRTKKTNALNIVYFPTQQGFMRVHAETKPWFERAKKSEKNSGLKTEEQRELAFDYMETMSYDQMIHDGLQVDRPPTAEEIRIGNEWAAGNVDLIKVSNYMMELDGLIEAMTKEKGSALNTQEINLIKAELQRSSYMTEADIKAAEQTAYILTQDMNELSLYNVRRLATALMKNTPTREEFARDNNLSGRTIKAVKELEQMYQELAEVFDIPDYRQLRGFINHVREYGKGSASGFDSTFLKQRAAGKLGNLRDFVSDRVRTGEINQFNTDPYTAIATYIRTGFEKLYLKDAWETAQEYVIRESIRQHGSTDQYAATDFYKILQGYMDDVKGLPSESTIRANQLFQETLVRLGVELEGLPVVGKLFRRGQGAGKWLGNIDLTKDVVNTFLSMHTMSALALRMGLGHRDFYDYMQAYGSRVGYTRAFTQLKNTNPLTPSGGAIIKDLKERGIINTQRHIEFGHGSESTRNKINRLAELGLIGSLQPMYHTWIQAATYMDMWHTVPRELGKVKSESNPKGTQTLNEAYEKIKVFTFDEGVKKEFDRLVKEGDIEGAADYLGRANAVEISGRYGLGNNPEKWKTNWGRLLTQFGYWPVFRRTQFLRGLSQGTRKDRLGFLGRHIMGQAALYGLGKGFGFNFTNWYTVPGFAFTGSPVYSHLVNLGYLINGSEQDRYRALNNFNRLMPTFTHPLSLYVPGSYVVYDFIKALEDPNIRTIFQQLGRMQGIKPSEEPPVF